MNLVEKQISKSENIINRNGRVYFGSTPIGVLSSCTISNADFGRNGDLIPENIRSGLTTFGVRGQTSGVLRIDNIDLSQETIAEIASATASIIAIPNDDNRLFTNGPYEIELSNGQRIQADSFRLRRL